MQDRIKKIRKAHGLTQTEFGSRIGVKGNTVTGYENGLRTPSDAIVLAICREFCVDEIWLRTGVGDMYRKMSKGEALAAFMGDVLGSGDDDFRRRLTIALSSLSAGEWQMLEQVTDRLLDSLRSEASDETIKG